MSALGRFFARLFGRRPQPAPPRPVVLEDAPAPAAAAPVDLEVAPRSELAVTPALGAAAGEAEVIAATAGVALVDGEAPTSEDEDVFEEEERAADAQEEPGRGADLDDKIAARAAAVPYLRQVAEEEALCGEHRVRPTDPSGPGTLAEALTRLEAEGRLTCELGEDADGAPLLVYKPTPSIH